MPSRLRLLAAALLAFVGGCAQAPRHRTDARLLPTLAYTPANSPAPVARVTAPGTAFTRASPAEPFAPRLVATTQVAHGDLFIHAFDGSGPPLRSATHLHRGQTAFLLPLARNYARDADGRTDLTYELTIRKPDGSADGPPAAGVVWQEPVARPDLVLYPSISISFWTEPSDPLGDYRVVVRIHDHLAGETVELEHLLTVVAYAPPELAADFEPLAWHESYYQNPRPELALSALPRCFERLPADQRAAAQPALLGFYDQLLTDNPWLLPAFCARLATARPDEAYALSLVLGFHLRGADSPPAGVSFAAWIRLADFRSHAWPSDPDRPLDEPAQLEALWGRFLASGLYAPVARLLLPLGNLSDLGAADRPVPGAAPDTPGDEILDAPLAPSSAIQRDLLLRSALWSLRRYSRQHPLVRAYLDWTLRAGELPPAQLDLLKRVLAAPETPSVTAR